MRKVRVAAAAALLLAVIGSSSAAATPRRNVLRDAPITNTATGNGNQVTTVIGNGNVVGNGNQVAGGNIGTVPPTSSSSPPVSTPPTAAPRHTLAYYQTGQQTGASQPYVSPLPLAGAATELEISAFHLNNDGQVFLNDEPPSAPDLRQMWSDVSALQSQGVKTEMLLGGAGQGSYANLHNDFNRFYPLLRAALKAYHFDGVDLDIEETFSLADTEKLIDQLRTDFGPEFLLTMSPVASDLEGTTNFSGGFSYRQLESERGSKISWYSAQFYCGWATLAGDDFDSVVRNGFLPSRVEAGTLTNPANCSGGYLPLPTLVARLRDLVAKYPTLVGAAGWEYFNALGVSGLGPASWYAQVKTALGG